LPRRGVNPNALGGRPTSAFYLNEEQALLICMFARTDKAKQVRTEVIRVFTAWRRGNLAPMVQAPTSMKEALLLALSQCEPIEKSVVIEQP
jgi:phage anti-repressor protein